MNPWTYRSLIIALLLFPSISWAQTNKTPAMETKIGVGMTDVQFLEVETQLSQGLPTILSKLQETAEYVKKDDWESARISLNDAMKEGQREKEILKDPKFFNEIETYVDKARKAFTLADKAINTKNKPVALSQLKNAYRYVKTISESPVLKLAATEIALGQASRLLGQRDYQNAGLFLQRAIDNITQVQQDPRLAHNPELAKLKSEIVITQQQVTMGKLQDEKRLHRFYPGLAAARTNTLNSYYSIWNRSDAPWEMY